MVRVYLTVGIRRRYISGSFLVICGFHVSEVVHDNYEKKNENRLIERESNESVNERKNKF